LFFINFRHLPLYEAEIDNLSNRNENSGNSNKLVGVGDAATYGTVDSRGDFQEDTSGNTTTEYDANGNMNKDKNKDMQIDYNLLVLPQSYPVVIEVKILLSEKLQLVLDG